MRILSVYVQSNKLVGRSNQPRHIVITHSRSPSVLNTMVAWSLVEDSQTVSVAAFQQLQRSAAR